ncbi:unnamed protein product [Didymodactylos carnosus]|uniref:Uncharacterized protein n=1 Tax=Didymodactylos carnosus TaxID=1234261 RepID=A0A8S2FIQ3_9BILA|nr:unnamed protein product [Didymodactylos carnosus]CAF4269627.1 unnamed protein product [Didymodactylos carnosus]
MGPHLSSMNRRRSDSSTYAKINQRLVILENNVRCLNNDFDQDIFRLSNDIFNLEGNFNDVNSLKSNVSRLDRDVFDLQLKSNTWNSTDTGIQYVEYVF